MAIIVGHIAWINQLANGWPVPWHECIHSYEAANCEFPYSIVYDDEGEEQVDLPDDTVEVFSALHVNQLVVSKNEVNSNSSSPLPN